MENIKDIDRPFRVTLVDKNGVRFFVTGMETLQQAAQDAQSRNEALKALGLTGAKYEAGPKE